MRTIDRRSLLGLVRDAQGRAGPDRKGLTEQEARALADRILGLSGAEETQVRLASGWRANTRFAVNRVTTAGSSEDITASITARFGKRAASITTNRLDEDGLREAVRGAEELARLSPENPERLPLPGPQSYATVHGYFDSTAELDADRRAAVAASAIAEARESGDLEAAGFLRPTAGSTTIANSAGLFAYHPGTQFEYSITARASDGSGSGWAGTGGRDWSEVEHEELSARAVEKAMRSRDPRPLEPGVYTAVLEPAAVSELVGLLARSLSARSADEGRSAFSRKGGGTKIGEPIVDSRVTISSDPAALGAAPFAGAGGFGGGFGGAGSDDAGLPLKPTTWIDKGVLENLFYSRYWAQRQGVEPTGFPNTFIMQGEDRSLEDLVSSTERGVLVTRFWYIRAVDPRTILYTGLTRDGVFLIEDGRIAHPVNNFRWNDSPLAVLGKLEAMSRPVRVTPTREVPAIRTSEFTFSSVSEAI
jgi:predicted Zn-dependent protease